MSGSRLAVIVMILALAVLNSRVSRTAQDSNPERIKPADVDGARIIGADREPGNWMSHGRDYGEQRYSPLKEVNEDNVGSLGLAWHYDLDTYRGQEATPIVVDGVMYVASAWSKVFALDAVTGSLLWSYDPKVPPEWAVNACCDVVNRGVAVWKGKVFVGTLDGRLVALDAATGKPVWETLTIDRNFRYTITGAPRVAKGKVFIGNGGAEMGVRGYVSAYDAETGKMSWRFYTVPGDPSKPFENKALETAAKTWTGEWWKLGGGGTVWDSIVYDPEFDLLYIGVSNGSPWNRRIRSPGGGDNLFLSSIVALKPDTGEYVWHYQETPGEMWDYTACQQITLADLTIEGRARKVILHAPKNGFFYVLDRSNGALISAKPYTQVNWASGIDIKTGRPIETAIARYAGNEPVVIVPGPAGAHNWQPVAYSVKGQQYVAVLAGWGGVFPLITGEIAFKSGRVRNISRMLTFKLGGKASLPPMPKFEEPALDPPPATADEATVKNGERLFQRYCAACHGDVAVGGGVVADLRYSKTLPDDRWFDVVLGGSLRKVGMVSFVKELSRKDATDISAYVIFRAHQTLAETKRGK